MSSSVATKGSKALLTKSAKRDPELYALLGVMCGIFGVAGYYFGRHPTGASSDETKVAIAGSPWSDGARSDITSKYQYHPKGDPRNPPKDAPSALHSVVIPNVNLPKELHEKYNKWGKEGF
ncbi:hypothetical protein BDZ91DRAFT_708878 [Kalaharituber pfeilii]|nr:hypothetical protein BDZ91DRAFT_708878 [Kalaharituber pfeilii]